MDLKWTHERRKYVFSRLAKELGANYREKGLLKTQYLAREKEILQECAAYLTNHTKWEFEPSAIKNQVDWAFDEPSKVKSSHVMVFCQCKVAAHEAGLIGPLNTLPAVREK